MKLLHDTDPRFSTKWLDVKRPDAGFVSATEDEVMISVCPVFLTFVNGAADVISRKHTLLLLNDVNPSHSANIPSVNAGGVVYSQWAQTILSVILASTP